MPPPPLEVAQIVMLLLRRDLCHEPVCRGLIIATVPRPAPADAAMLLWPRQPIKLAMAPGCITLALRVRVSPIMGSTFPTAAARPLLLLAEVEQGQSQGEARELGAL